MNVSGRLVPRQPGAGGIAGRHDPERFWRYKSDVAARLEWLADEAKRRLGSSESIDR